MPVTYLKYAEKIPENLSEIDDLEFMLNYRIQEEREYRFLWIPDGFGILKSKLQYAGNYAFRRHDGDGPLSIMDKLRMMRYWKYIFNRD